MTLEGMKVELIESQLSGNLTIQQALCEYMDDWIGTALTGQEARSASRISARFETDLFGQPWAPRAPAMVASYPDDGNRRILDRYDDMLARLNSQPPPASGSESARPMPPTSSGERTACRVEAS